MYCCVSTSTPVLIIAVVNVSGAILRVPTLISAKAFPYLYESLDRLIESALLEGARCTMGEVYLFYEPLLLVGREFIGLLVGEAFRLPYVSEEGHGVRGRSYPREEILVPFVGIDPSEPILCGRMVGLKGRESRSPG